jgi:osmoprotectant transport system permease protein
MRAVQLPAVAFAAAAALVAVLLVAPRANAERVSVGSKAFPESWIVGEALASLARGAGAEAEHRRNLGGTEIVYEALRSGAIDAYPEYTGTLREVVLHAPGASDEDVTARLAREGIGVTASLGFDDSYALAVAGPAAARDHLATISDAARHPELRAAFTHEFLGRADGWPGLRDRYGLAFGEVRGVQHQIAFDAITSGGVDVVDVYTTDPQIERLGLRVLDDDRGFFPRYDAVVLYRLDLETKAPAALAAMMRLVGHVDRATMARANAAMAMDARDVSEAAVGLLRDALGSDAAAAAAGMGGPTRLEEIARDVARHVELVAASLAASVVIGVPLGIFAARRRRTSGPVLGAVGVLQTIPSLALLALLVPVVGIGVVPAALALLLYGLLPIVQGTYTGLTTIPAPLAESAAALPLPPMARLVRIELPLASPSILAGIRTSAVIGVGTATIAALVGAGGLGDPILQGITLRNTSLILAGAAPAAALAIVVQLGFGVLERALVPRGMRVRTHAE